MGLCHLLWLGKCPVPTLVAALLHAKRSTLTEWTQQVPPDLFQPRAIRTAGMTSRSSMRQEILHLLPHYIGIRGGRSHIASARRCPRVA